MGLTSTISSSVSLTRTISGLGRLLIIARRPDNNPPPALRLTSRPPTLARSVAALARMAVDSANAPAFSRVNASAGTILFQIATGTVTTYLSQHTISPITAASVIHNIEPTMANLGRSAAAPTTPRVPPTKPGSGPALGNSTRSSTHSALVRINAPTARTSGCVIGRRITRRVIITPTNSIGITTPSPIVRSNP